MKKADLLLAQKTILARQVKMESQVTLSPSFKDIKDQSF